MFGILFGWRKASRCKKLIRRVQCRLKLLKNKRTAIVRQSRDDMAQLLKHGHEEAAFDRVERIFLDEKSLIVYDLLDHFSEFIIIHLSYIRKHKDCPNDIGEAVSTLIFASARCGDLPELKEIRMLFGERYGHKFATVALELLHGNLVNRQIKENLSIQSVSDDIKLSIVDEIWRSCFHTDTLAIEYYPQLQNKQAIQTWEDEMVTPDTQSKSTRNEPPGKILSIDLPAESRRLSDEPQYSSPSSVELSTNIYNKLSMEKLIHPKSLKKEEDIGVESSPESSLQHPKELVYLDDIEEFKSQMSTHVNYQDKRLFMFKSFSSFSTEKIDTDSNRNYNDKSEKSGLRKTRKSKRQRRRSLSQESTNVKDLESTLYYSERDERSKNQNLRKYHKKTHFCELKDTCISKLDQIENCESEFKEVVHECNLIEPCYLCTSDDKDDWGNQDKQAIAKKRSWAYNCPSLDSAELKKSGKGEGTGMSSSTCSTEESNVQYMRAMTMPPEWPIDSHGKNVNRSISFPCQKPKNEFRHVHPKLPDYDQLAATFTALKKANSHIISN